eukprot:INCI6211.7.p1 GENE.INCI6211.7~~INCI6211.7.p1  ORF type:complete len:285 (-),score=41.21 INCI6211.7:197-1051(-)
MSSDKKLALGWTGGRLGRSEESMASTLQHLHESFHQRLQELVRSVKSLRASCRLSEDDRVTEQHDNFAEMDRIGITVLVPNVSVIPPHYAQQLRFLNVEITTPQWLRDPPDPAFTTSWWFRLLALPSSPYRQTLQLDADTVVCECFEEKGLWKLFAERYDWAATHAPSLFHDSDKTQTEAGGDPSIPRAFVQYNNAVSGYRWTPAIASMFARALESLRELPQYGLRDQAALRQALWKAPQVHDYTLPDIWQCRVPKDLKVHCGNHHVLTQSVEQIIGALACADW